MGRGDPEGRSRAHRRGDARRHDGAVAPARGRRSGAGGRGVAWQRATCHLHRQDVERAAIPLIYTIGALSFSDARARGSSEIEYQENDEWLFADLLPRPRLEPDRLGFDADYGRGGVIKTHSASPSA